MRGQLPARYLEAATFALAVALAGFSVTDVVTGDPVRLREWPLIVSFVATIAAGDVWRVSVLGSRRFAPVALAASLAWVMTITAPPDDTLVTHGSAVILLGVGVASLAGSLVRMRVKGDPLDLHEVGLRVVVVSVALLLFRIVSVDGRTLREWAVASGEHDDRPLVAVVMLVVAAVALCVQLAVMSMQRAARDHAVIWQAAVDEVGAVLPLALATTATSAVVALAIGALGAVAVPLFMVPLVLLQLAVRQQSAVREAQRQTIQALSRLTEQGEFTPMGHSARVARLAVPIGRQLGQSERDLLDLEYAALLHDLGQVSLRRPIPGGATVEISPLDQRRIAGTGAAILARTTDLTRLSGILAEQATPYRRAAEVGRLSLSARILKVANAFDDLAGADPSPADAAQALRRIRLSTGYEYDPLVVRALCSVLEREGRLSSRDLERLDI